MASVAIGSMIPPSSEPKTGPSKRRRAMAEKKIQPKPASTETANNKTAAAGVEKKSQRRTKQVKRVARRK
jgi:hypothetical protein